jgi:hypothetical protein
MYPIVSILTSENPYVKDATHNNGQTQKNKDKEVEEPRNLSPEMIKIIKCTNSIKKWKTK